MNHLHVKTGKLLLAIFLIINFSTQGITDAHAIGTKINLLLGLILGLAIGFLLVRNAFKETLELQTPLTKFCNVDYCIYNLGFWHFRYFY